MVSISQRDKKKPQMAELFPLVWMDTSTFDTLFTKTLPRFEVCSANVTYAQILADNCTVTDDVLTAAHRSVFENLTPSAAAQHALAAHYRLLVAHRGLYANVIVTALKKNSTYASKILSGNCIITEKTTWYTVFPDKIRFAIDTLDDEIGITLWMLACVCVYNAYTLVMKAPLTHSACVDNNDAHRATFKQALDHLKLAMSIYAYLSTSAAVEPYARFNRNGYMCTKAYVCKAYEKIANSLCYVVAANSLVALDSSPELLEKVIVTLEHAEQSANDAYRFIKNEAGADDASTNIEVCFYEINMKIALFVHFHKAKLYVVSPTIREAAFRIMVLASNSSIVTDVRGNMKTAIAIAEETSDTLENKYAFGYWLRQLNTINPFSAMTTSNETKFIMQDIEKLGALPAITDVEIKTYAPIDIKKFIF